VCSGVVIAHSVAGVVRRCDPAIGETLAFHWPGFPAARAGGGLDEVVANDRQILPAPEIGGCVRVVARGDQRGAGKHEPAHGRQGATEGDEHALEARQDALAAGAVFTDDHGGGFAQPERGALGGRGIFEEFLKDAAPRIPMRAGAEEKAIGGLQSRPQGGEVVAIRKRDDGDIGARCEVRPRLGHEHGGIARVPGQGGVEEEQAGAGG